MLERLGSRQISLLRTIRDYPGKSKNAIVRIDDRGESDPRSLPGRHMVIDRLIELGLVYDRSHEYAYALHVTAKGRQVLGLIPEPVEGITPSDGEAVTSTGMESNHVKWWGRVKLRRVLDRRHFRR